MDWLREIELEEYAQALQGTGINGPVVVNTHTHTLSYHHHVVTLVSLFFMTGYGVISHS